MIQRPLLERTATLALLFWSSVALPLPAQRNHDDYDEVNPWLGFEQSDAGPDSATVAGFLADLAASQPVVCQIAADNLGNNWHRSNGGYRAGMLQGEAAPDAARETLSHRVTDPRALARLSDALGDQNPCVRRAASHLLGQSKAPEARRLLRAGLRASEARVRGPPRLVAALGDRDPELRIIAAASLGEIGDSAAVPALANAYRSDDPRLRYAVVKALADTDDRRGTATLTIARQDSDRSVRHAASEALKDRDDDD